MSYEIDTSFQREKTDPFVACSLGDRLGQSLSMNNKQLKSVDVAAVLLGLSQLNQLIDQQGINDYWQRGLQLLQQQLEVSAVSLYLFDSGLGSMPKSRRMGSFAQAALDLVEAWESNLSEAYTVFDPSNLAGLLEVVDLPGGTGQLLHIRIVLEHSVRGATTFLFEAGQLPDSAQQAFLCHLIQVFCGNGLRALYLQTTRVRLERANLLYQISQTVTSSLDPQIVFHQTTELARHTLHAQAATLFTIDRENRELVFTITKGSAAQALEEKRIPMDYGVVGWVATHGKPRIVNNPRESTVFNSGVDSQTGFVTRNIICVPLRVHEHTVAVLEVLNKEDPAGFTQDDIEWLSVMGQQIAIALDNAKLFAREQEKVRELATLNAVSQTINSDLDVGAVLDAVTQSALEIASADRSELFLVDHEKQALKLFASAGHGNGTGDSGKLYPLESNFAGWAIAHNQPLVVRHALLDARYQPRPDRPELDRSSIVAVPLGYRNRVVGAIVVYSLSGRPFDLEKQEVLQTFANQVAVALQNAELYQNLRSEQERIIKAQEEVRHHLARELHDNTAQMLSLIIMNLDMSRRMLNTQQFDKARSEIDEIERIARQANQEVRTLLFELRPIILESRGLIPALHAYYRQLESSLNCKIHLNTSPLGFDMSLQGGSSIFSIIQEAVNNIRKHAQAANIWIRVFADQELVHFEIEDDGVGFAVTESDSEEAEQISFGLRNMHERARMLSGELAVTSPRSVGNGTLVKGAAPIKRLLAPKDE